MSHAAGFLDSFGRLLGMDGFILMAFILGLPANEIVLPILLMSYVSAGTMVEPESLAALHNILVVQNGWTWLTALSVMLAASLPLRYYAADHLQRNPQPPWTLIALLMPLQWRCW